MRSDRRPLLFWRRMFIPFLVVSVIVIGSLRTLTSASVPGSEYSACQTSLIASQAAASDVVFFGSSRTGAAIDAVLISASLSEGETAEKVVYTLGSELDRDLAVRTYLRSRGVPSVLALELSFERDPQRVDPTAALTEPTARTATFFDSLVYTDFVRSMLAARTGALADLAVRSSIWSPLRYTLARIDSGWSVATHHPALGLTPAAVCVWKFGPREGRWVVGDSLPYDPSVPPPATNLLERWQRVARKFRTFDPRDPWTSQELALLDDMVAAANDAGVPDVVLYYLPSYGESKNVIDLDYIAARYPGATIFDGRIPLASQPGLADQYDDRTHLNRYGAGEVSFAVANAIEQILRG